jgi:hypothetical protein
MKIATQDLKSFLDKIFSKIQLEYPDEFEINEDYFWYIPLNEVYNPLKDPKNLTLGQLSFDYESLKNNSDFLPVDLIKISNLLRYLGEKMI